MVDDKIPQPDAKTLDNFLRAEAKRLREKDKPPTSRKQWDERRAVLVKKMREAMGPTPDKECALEPRVVGTIKRDGYQIEKLIFQSRPDVWVTASAYVPTNVKGKVPAVLVVHGHWAGARRDPVVQARCLGLVKLGFFVLAVDAFGSGERYTAPARGTYHGALYGATLWPTGHTLLGMQVYDNKRAVDYLCTRPEVDATKLGVTGASGGGNQSMYAGAMDERLGAVVPVCSVGTYQSYLHAACCVCEVLPGALRFTEEGEVLGLVAPRALMVINATKDAFQFSIGEAQKSLAMATPIFKLHGVAEKVKHVTFESPHAYNKEMREAMYGWMTRWLKGEGKGDPIPEPEHKIETMEDLACFPDPKKDRPKGFLLLPEFAGREGRALVKKHDIRPKHIEDWDARAMLMKSSLEKQLLGDVKLEEGWTTKDEKVQDGDISVLKRVTAVEPGLTVRWYAEYSLFRPMSSRIFLHLDGMEEARKHPLRVALHNKMWLVGDLELRGTGAMQAKGDTVGAAPDHNSAEHALWVGRPLLGQWLADVRRVVGKQLPQVVGSSGIVGIGQAGVVALCAAASFRWIESLIVLDVPVSFATDQPYGKGTRMGLLAPGILRIGDIPHLAALIAPRKLQIIGGVRSTGEKLKQKELDEAFAFTRDVYKLHKATDNLVIKESDDVKEIVKRLG